ncbi:hypothetical protein PPERSA_05391 [Pseudocohnilembus persalinus]|uniref:Uncharacterized protein n=1 Tax=Pseudocohnilembus persalinus TaxID=266149 RepID=A0A0V0R7W5_PSEPJ|nr:hypothetical protein PPERSA_05391 [Pseudocohnilembus persalinus]|eukprot:KRX10571.1 hypothetical protein PPERSA_05391 [Pseudocohnilembus persalinus]
METDLKEKINNTDISQDNMNSQRSEGINNQFEKQGIEKIDEDETLKTSYKKKLIIMVSGIFLICVLIIIERIFNSKLQSLEAEWIASVQDKMGLTVDSSDGEGYLGFSQSWFYKLIGYLGIYEINVLIITHFLITLFVGIDALVSIKMFYIIYLTQFFISCMDQLYEGPRPYWISKDIASPLCVKTYGLPSYNKSNGRSRISAKQIIIAGIFLAIQIAYFTFQWIIGQMFICAMFISILYFILVFYMLMFMDNQIHYVIKKSSIASYDAKKYVFYWFFWLILLEILSCMFYNGSEDYLSIEWVQNYIYCEQNNGTLPQGIPYNQLIGPWYTYLTTTGIFALISGIFAIAHTFRNIGEFEWFKGSNGQRALRIVIANLFILPSWIIVGFQQDIINTQWNQEIEVLSEKYLKQNKKYVNILYFNYKLFIYISIFFFKNE